MAERYPRSEFHGYDISDHMLKLGRENVAAAGVTNVTLHNATDDSIPGDASFDFAWFGDVVHDLAHPVPVLASVRQSLKDDGTVLVVDVAAGETLADNIANPKAPLFYGFSQLVCMSQPLRRRRRWNGNARPFGVDTEIDGRTGWIHSLPEDQR